MGRLLGVGPGRERGADAVADGHRVPALDHGPAAPRDAEDLERVARAGDRLPRHPRHVPGALGRARVDPRVRRVDPRAPVPHVRRAARGRRDLARAVAPRGAAVRAPARLAPVARGGLRPQQPRARRAVLRDLLGDVLPADLRGRDRDPRVASGRRGSTATRCRSRSCSSCCRDRAARRVAAGDARGGAAHLPRSGRRARWPRRRRWWSCPVSPRARPRCSCSPSPRSSLAAVGQEVARGVRVRRAVSHERVPVALVAVVRRNRRRYGGYLVHVGMAVLFVGVAGSTAFQHMRDARLVPGQSARLDGYDVRYVRATGQLSAEKISLGAVLEVRARRRGSSRRCARAAATTRRRIRARGRSAGSSTASRPARSACAPGRGATCGPRSSPTSARCGG